MASSLVELDGDTVHLGLRKAVALLVYLAVTQSPHRRDSLATLLWPESDQSRARADLRHSLSLLRSKLGAEWFEADRETVCLHDAADVWLDIDELRRLMRTWRDHGHREVEVCSRCVGALEQAVELYRGDFLAGFTLPDSASFDEWQLLETEGLRGELGSVLQRLARWHSEHGGYEAASGNARSWVALDPLHEPAQRELMQAYAQAGQRAAALRQYQECARVLETEMGLSPSQETTALYERIRAGRVDLAEPIAASPPFRHNLPAQPIPLVGRQRELSEIGERLDDPNCRLLTLVGPGGSGKTRLAIEAAVLRVDAFEDGVGFVSLAPLRATASIVPTIAQAVGFSFGGHRDLEEQLLAYLARRRMLLLLDNFEHLLVPDGRDEQDGTGLVTRLVEAAPSVKLLATSRAALRLQHEQLYPVTAMAYPERGAG